MIPRLAKPVIVFLLALVVVALTATVGLAQAHRASATVTVLHALPGFTADVYVNGELTLNGFEPQTATDPLELTPGDYLIEIRDVGASADSAPSLEGTLTLKAGQNVSIIAGLTPAGEPKLNVFANDLSPVLAGEARLVVRHVAAESDLDAKLDGDVVISSIGNSAEGSTEVPEGESLLEITAAGEEQGLLEPTDIDLGEGTETIVYVIGSGEQDTLDLMVQVVADLQSPATDIPTGDGGMAQDPGAPLWATSLTLAAALMAAGSMVSIVRSRSRWWR
jgi:hypothetical protein